MECERQNETKQYLEESKNLKVEIEELESVLGPDDTEVNFRRSLEEARGENGCVRVSSWWSVVRDGTCTKGG